jgi:hypothetical protein
VRSAPRPRAPAPPPALIVRCFAAEADRRRALLTAKNVLNEMKQLMAEHQSSEAPPGRLRRAFDLFEKRALPPSRRAACGKSSSIQKEHASALHSELCNIQWVSR